MFSAIHNIHHRNRHNTRVWSAQILIQRNTELFCCRLCHSKRCPQNCISTQFCFVCGTIFTYHQRINFYLVQCIFPLQFIGKNVINIFYRTLYAISTVTRQFTVSQFHCFKRPRRRPGGNGCSARCPSAQFYLHLNRWISSGI